MINAWMLWFVKALGYDSPGSGAVLERAPGLSDRLRDAVAWKDSRLIAPLVKYPLANQSA